MTPVMRRLLLAVRPDGTLPAQPPQADEAILALIYAQYIEMSPRARHFNLTAKGRAALEQPK